jgi:hypothetical protein
VIKLTGTPHGGTKYQLMGKGIIPNTRRDRVRPQAKDAPRSQVKLLGSNRRAIVAGIEAGEATGK